MNNQTTLTVEQMQARIAELEQQNQDLQAKRGRPAGPTLRVNEEKGTLSFYHGGRFPITLYRDQWLKVLSKAEEINNFIQENLDKLPATPPRKKKGEQEEVDNEQQVAA